jgi:hypothetical protein
MKPTLIMNKLAVIVFIIIGSFAASAQTEQEIQKDLRFFSKIIASPHIHLILKKGDKESIRLVHDDQTTGKINILVKGKTLHIYLDDARRVEKTIRYRDGRGNSSRGIYDGVSIAAYVTYQYLEGLEIRGQQQLTCDDPISAEEFTLKAYGENSITLSSLKTDYFKAALYGENELNIKDGKVVEQKYKLFGENKINTRDMKSAFTTTSIFGEGKLRINSSEQVRVDAFGEPEIYVDGGANINKRLVFGKASIYHR